METDIDAMEPLTIEVVSDVVCPWCYIGKRRLEAALELYAQAKPDAPPPKVSFHPFQLNPDLPPEGMLRADYVARKWGGRPSSEVYARVSGVGKSVGIDFEFDRPARFVDLEGGEAILADPSDITRQYREAVRQYLTDIDDLVRTTGIDYHRVKMHEPYADVLAKFLLGRTPKKGGR
jgi:hypothetical protein